MTYFFAVDPPKIAWNPKHHTVLLGEDITFHVEAMGDDLQFQWQRDGVDNFMHHLAFLFNQLSAVFHIFSTS